MGTAWFSALSVVFLFQTLLPVPEGVSAMEQIRCNSRSLRTVRAEILQAVRKGNNPPTLFQFGGKLVRVIQGAYGSFLEPLSLDALQHHLDCWAEFVVKRKGSEDPDACPPPLEFVRNILAMPGWDHDTFPRIERISTVPFFTSTGTLVMEPGYDAAARVLYEPGGLVVQSVPSNPTNDEVKQAKSLLLDEYLRDFPFESDADRANALAYLLTPFVRDLVGLLPMLIVDAPAAGTGKGLLLKCLAFVALGTVPAMTPQPENEAEWRKALTTLLVDLPTHTIFDNLAGALKSDRLCAVLTTGIWKDRELGTMRTIHVPVQCIFMGTANNLDACGDILRRLVWSRLDAKTERPDARKPEEFGHPDILAWAGEHRGELVHAALVLVQSWIARGKKPGSQTMGSYETWAQTMGGILDVAGVPGFLANAEKKRNHADEEAAQWAAFCEAWWAGFKAKDVGVRELFDLTEGQELLPSILTAEKEIGRKQKLGRAIHKMIDRCFGDYRIVNSEARGKGGTRQYHLEKRIPSLWDDIEREKRDLAQLKLKFENGAMSQEEYEGELAAVNGRHDREFTENQVLRWGKRFGEIQQQKEAEAVDEAANDFDESMLLA